MASGLEDDQTPRGLGGSANLFNETGDQVSGDPIWSDDDSFDNNFAHDRGVVYNLCCEIHKFPASFAVFESFASTRIDMM
jgi:hypothetical protein